MGRFHLPATDLPAAALDASLAVLKEAWRDPETLEQGAMKKWSTRLVDAWWRMWTAVAEYSDGPTDAPLADESEMSSP